jgi:hypothetical protein
MGTPGSCAGEVKKNRLMIFERPSGSGSPSQEHAHNGLASARREGRVPRPLVPGLRGLCALFGTAHNGLASACALRHRLRVATMASLLAVLPESDSGGDGVHRCPGEAGVEWRKTTP